MNINKKITVFITILAFVLGIVAPVTSITAQDNLAELSFVGPGRYDTDLMIIDGGETYGNYYAAGTASVYNTRDELVIELDVDNGWLLGEVSVFLGDELIPLASVGVLDAPTKEAVLRYNLLDDLEITWGQRDEENRLITLSVSAQLIEEEGSATDVYDGFVLGNRSLSEGPGWYMDYAIVHPLTGHFIDAPVGGIWYETPTNKGLTDDSGAFDYMLGESIALYLGDLFLGVTVAKDKVTPFDLVGDDEEAAVNMAMLLQSFDEDGAPLTGIMINEATIQAMYSALIDMEMLVTDIDFYDTAQIVAIIANTNVALGGVLTPVSYDEAASNLSKGTGSTIVRKNVSKSEDELNAKAKLELMTVYVPAQKANGDPVTLTYSNGDGVEERQVVKPLVACYTEEVPGTGASDVFAAVSRDEGETWQRVNLSKSADKSSFRLENGFDYPGNVKKPQIRVKGNYIMATWTSTYARTGRPTYAIKKDDKATDPAFYPFDNKYYEEDIWGVSGPQRSVDYADQGYPEVGEIPYSAVWTVRGIIDVATGDVQWYKPERLTSARRDAYQLAMNGVEGVGFAFTWQEDPEGLMPGEEAGPGEGWSGATTSHKTDIWYSYILWDDFAQIDEIFEAKGVLGEDENDEDLNRRPKALVPCKLPVRISDNDTVNLDSMNAVYDPDYPNSVAEEDRVYKEDIDALSEGDFIDVEAKYFKQILDDDQESGTHRYAFEKMPSYYKGPEITSKLYYKVNSQDADKYVAITEDGRMLDGDTGASRPNIMIQKYVPEEGNGAYNGDASGSASGVPKPSAWVVLCYEETKGAGSGRPDDVDETDSTPGGDQVGQTKYVPDEGKNVIYHTFDISEPDLISGGTIINPMIHIDSQEEREFYRDMLPEPLASDDGDLPGEDEDGYLYLTDDEGNLVLDWDGSKMPAYENARRPRMIIQGASAALANKGEGKSGTPLVMVYKMGEDGKGRPSDIMMKRWEIPFGYESISANPYDLVFMQEELYNISAVSPTETMINDERSEDSNGEGLKVLQWEQTIDNLDDDSWENGYEDARAHRGIIRGDKLAIAYDYTANWAAARNGNDVYDVYLRRSFNGGQSFTTNPKGEGVYHTVTYKTDIGSGLSSKERGDDLNVVGEPIFYAAGAFEPARNLSNLTNNQETVIEPRLVGGPSTIFTDDPETDIKEKPSDQAFYYPEDKRDTNTFWITYGTSSNPGDGGSLPKLPLDLYYSYTSDFGDTFYEVTKEVNPESTGNHAGETKVVWDWLAKDSGTRESEQAEAQIRMSPDGSTFYAVWNETGSEGSNVMFRRLMLDDKTMDSTIDMVDTRPPVIRVVGIGDGDKVSQPVNVHIYLNEMGSWTASLTSNDVTQEFTDAFTVDVQEGSIDYELVIEAVDLSGNTATETLTFNINSAAPTITINGVENNLCSPVDLLLAIDIYADTYSIDLQKDDVAMAYSNPMSLTEEGVYTLEVEAYKVGVDAPASNSLTFEIDKTAPKVEIVGVSDGVTYGNSARPEITVTDTPVNDIESLSIQVNGRDFLTGTKISDAGYYVLIVEAVDRAGNTTYKEVKFTIKKTYVSSSKKDTTVTISDDPVALSDFNDLTDEMVTGIIEHDVHTTIAPAGHKLNLYIPAWTFQEDLKYRITPQSLGSAEGANVLRIGDYLYKIEFMDMENNLVTVFDQDIQLSFLFTDINMPEGTIPEDVEISYYDGNLNGGVWIVVPSDYDPVTGKISAWVNHLSIYSAMALTGFPDLADCCGHWAEDDIYKLASLGIISGDEDGNVNPNAYTTRQEMAKMLVNALDLKLGSPINMTDSDDISEWAVAYVDAALSSDVMQLDDMYKFNPLTNATRAEMIYAASKGFTLEDKPITDQHFMDEGDIDPNHLETVNKLVSCGLIHGYPDNTFRPDGDIKRSEMFKIIVRYLAYASDTENEGN